MGSVMEVPLSRGLVAVVDAVDFERVTSQGKWYADPCSRTYYGRRNYWPNGRAGGCKSMKMHRFITGLPFVDHVNGDGLDNRRANLRAADHTNNARNRQIRSDNTTGFKGVHPRPDGRYGAAIQGSFLGLFDSAEEAARAYDAQANIRYGEFAWFNFPKDGGR